MHYVLVIGLAAMVGCEERQLPNHKSEWSELGCAELAEPIDGPSTCMLGKDPESPPTLLAETGCFSSIAPLVPAAGVIPYALNAPLYSDGAEKGRWIASTGRAIEVGDGQLDFATGTVLLKQFNVDSVPVETRVMIRGSNDWVFHTYVWTGEGPVLATGAQIIDVGFDWEVPSRASCRYCHGSSARVLGPELGQLDRDVCYGGGEARSQLDALAEWGVLPASPSAVPALADPTYPGAAITDRARSYLHVNCAPCHRPGGWTPPNMTMDLRYDIDIDDTQLCGVPVQFMGAIDNSDLRIDPGDALESQLYIRMRGGGLGKMPPFGAHVDPDGTSLIGAWIHQMTACD